jgi:hypothetical protein
MEIACHTSLADAEIDRETATGHLKPGFGSSHVDKFASISIFRLFYGWITAPQQDM